MRNVAELHDVRVKAKLTNDPIQPWAIWSTANQHKARLGQVSHDVLKCTEEKVEGFFWR